MELPTELLDDRNKDAGKIDDINSVYEDLFLRNKKEDEIIKELQHIEKQNVELLFQVFSLYFVDLRKKKNTIHQWGIALYERYGKYEEALVQLSLILDNVFDENYIQAVFRICKKINNYKVAETFIEKYKLSPQSGSFHILYELIYYYHHIKNNEQLNYTLNHIEKRFAHNIPAQNTLRNIYIQLQRFDDAKRVGLTSLDKKFGNELSDSTKQMLEILESQVASQKQVAFIQQMIRGFSHEMGQPITNIRYTIQFYSKVLKQNFSPEKVFEIFDMILKETERMSDLAQQLKPITASKNQVLKYNLITLIEQRILVENARLSSNNVEVIVKNPKNIDVNIVGDLQKMEQVINNLLINAIDVLAEINETKSKQIIVEITSGNKNFIELDFKDTGTGIPADIADKIFTVYFTTKTNKGQGLGLFIVKNLLQAQGGDIQLEKTTKQGACFKLKIPKISKNFNTI